MTYFGSSRDLTDYVKSVTGSDVIAANGEYKVHHKKFHVNERVYMYGRRQTPDVNFECSLMGTSAEEITDVIHSDESIGNGIKLVLSTSGAVLSGICIASLLNN